MDPLAVYKRLGLPNLRKWAGVGLTVMLVFLVLANIIVALKDSVGAWVTGGGNLKKAVWACCRLERRA